MAEEILSHIRELRANYHKGATRSAKYRIEQLRNLQRGFKECEEEFTQAKIKDLGISPFSSWILEGLGTKESIQFAIDHVSEWMKAVSVDTPALIAPGKSSILYEPLGVVGIIGAYNFPIFTSVGPIIAAMVAGNAILFKPSENCVEVDKVYDKLFSYLDSNLYRLIHGKGKARAMATQPFDGLVFTGSPGSGARLASAAALNLCPCLLELGGKNPSIVDESANLGHAAAKLSLGRFVNHGQVCISPDYVFVHKKVKDRFVPLLIKAIKEQWGPGGNLQDEYCDMGKSIDSEHTQVLLDMLNSDHGGKVLLGGVGSAEGRYVEPTVIESPHMDSEIMKGEIFGPILPIIYFEDISECIEIIGSYPKAMVCYYFGSMCCNKNLDRVKRETSSGTFSVNDTLLYAINNYLPFGGTGNSGFGKYHGVHGFRNLSHGKCVLERPSVNFFPFSQLNPPYTKSKQKFIRTLVLVMKGTQATQLKVLFVLLMFGVMCIYSGFEDSFTPFWYLMGHAIMILWTLLFLFC